MRSRSSPICSRRIPRPGRAGAALRSVLELATEFGVDVIAKSVETIDQHERLVSAGCLFGQGWLYGAPETVGRDRLRHRREGAEQVERGGVRQSGAHHGNGDAASSRASKRP